MPSQEAGGVEAVVFQKNPVGVGASPEKSQIYVSRGTLKLICARRSRYFIHSKGLIVYYVPGGLGGFRGEGRIFKIT